MAHAAALRIDPKWAPGAMGALRKRVYEYCELDQQDAAEEVAGLIETYGSRLRKPLRWEKPDPQLR